MFTFVVWAVGVYIIYMLAMSGLTLAYIAYVTVIKRARSWQLPKRPRDEDESGSISIKNILIKAGIVTAVLLVACNEFIIDILLFLARRQ